MTARQLDRFAPAVLLSTGLLAVVALGQAAGSDSLATTITEMLIRLTMVVGLYVFVGNSGITSFGHVGFACIGAYAAAWATAEPSFKQIMLRGLPGFLQDNQYPFAAAMLGAMAVPALVGLLLGAAIMRLAGIAASIATFAFLMIVTSIYSNWDSVTAGVSSIVGIPTTVGLWTALAFAVLAIVAAQLFQLSRFGLMLKASRDDSVAAQASAVGVVRVRLIAFVLSAAIAGAGGGLYAQFLGILTIDSFNLSMTFITIAMLVVGGIGSLTGAVAGVAAVTFAVEILRVLERGVTVGATAVALPQGSQEIGLGLVLALILIFRPSGLTRSQEVRWPRLRAGAARTAEAQAPDSAEQSALGTQE